MSMNKRDWAIFKSLLGGGLAVGGGVALTANLLNYLRHLNDASDVDDDDDDTLYIYKKPEVTEKKASEDDSGRGTYGLALGLPAALAGGVGMMTLINKLYTKMRMKQAQKELDEAQRMFVEAQGYDVKDKKSEKITKQAGLTTTELVGGGAIGLPLLLMLATGITANKILENKYPIKKPKPKAPKRIEIVDAPEDAEVEKVASYESDATELMLRTLYLTKSANSYIADLVAGLALQGSKPFLKAASDIGFMPALNTVKGASSVNNIDPLREHVAITYLTKKARLAPSVELVAAMEFSDRFPTTMEAVSNMPEDKQEYLYKAACILGRLIRHEISAEMGIKLDKSDEALYEKAASDVLENAVVDEALDTAVPYGSTLKSLIAEEEQENEKEDKDKDDKGTKVKITATSISNRKMLDDLNEDVIDKILSPN